MAGAVALRGQRELFAAFAKAEKAERLGLRNAMRDIAEPVQSTAEQLAVERIRRIGPKWYRMRIGVTRKLLYVAPKQRGVKTRGHDPRRRGEQFANLLATKAMEPALAMHEHGFEAAVEAMIDKVADGFNQGGPTP